jgi:hypothetical protein
MNRAILGATAAGSVSGVKWRPRRVELAKVDESSLCEVFKDVAPELVRLAKIPNPTPDEISSYFYDVPFCWIDHALSAAFSDDGRLVRLLCDVKNRAVGLRLQLEKVRQRFDGTIQHLEKGNYDEDIDDLDLMALQRLQDCAETCTVSRLLKELSELAGVIHRLVPQERGRRRGVERYPGLSELVFWLEVYAQTSGGTFTAHRKLCAAKGSLVEALDRLRDRFLSSSDLNYLADLIPARAKHPIAAYERTLKAAREAAQRMNSF